MKTITRVVFASEKEVSSLDDYIHFWLFCSGLDIWAITPPPVCKRKKIIIRVQKNTEPRRSKKRAGIEANLPILPYTPESPASLQEEPSDGSCQPGSTIKEVVSF